MVSFTPHCEGPRFPHACCPTEIRSRRRPELAAPVLQEAQSHRETQAEPGCSGTAHPCTLTFPAPRRMRPHHISQPVQDMTQSLPWARLHLTQPNTGDERLLGRWVAVTPMLSALETVEQHRGDLHAWGQCAATCVSPTELNLKQEMGILTQSEHGVFQQPFATMRWAERCGSDTGRGGEGKRVGWPTENVKQRNSFCLQKALRGFSCHPKGRWNILLGVMLKNLEFLGCFYYLHHVTRLKTLVNGLMCPRINTQIPSPGLPAAFPALPSKHVVQPIRTRGSRHSCRMA